MKSLETLGSGRRSRFVLSKEEMSILSQYAHILSGSAQVADPLDETVEEGAEENTRGDAVEKQRPSAILDVDAPAFRYSFDWAPNFAETVVIDWLEVSAPVVDGAVRLWSPSDSGWRVRQRRGIGSWRR